MIILYRYIHHGIVLVAFRTLTPAWAVAVAVAAALAVTAASPALTVVLKVTALTSTRSFLLIIWVVATFVPGVEARLVKAAITLVRSLEFGAPAFTSLIVALAFVIAVPVIVIAASCSLTIIVSAYRTTILISGTIGAAVFAMMVAVADAPASCLLGHSFHFSLFEIDCSFGSFIDQLETYKFGYVLEIVLL